MSTTAFQPQTWRHKTRRKTDEQIRGAVKAIYAGRAAVGEARPNAYELGKLIGCDRNRVGPIVRALDEAGELPPLESQWGKQPATREHRAPDRRLTTPREPRPETPWHVRLRREILACERRIGMRRATA